MRALFLLMVLGLFTAIAVPNLQVRRCGRSPVHTCYANQKTIAGAVEMYNLDFDANVQGLTPRLREALVRFGYLQRFPEDPDGSEGEYVLTSSVSNGVACTEHGGIRGADGGPWTDADFERLEAERAGLTLEQIAVQRRELAKLPPPPPPPPPASWF